MAKVIIVVIGMVIVVVKITIKIKRYLYEKSLEKRLEPLKKSLLSKSTDELRAEYSRLVYKQIETAKEDKELDKMVEIYQNELDNRSYKKRRVNKNLFFWMQRFLFQEDFDED